MQNDLSVLGDVTVDGTISGGSFIPTNLELKDGTAALPSLSFNADTKTGLYRDTTAPSGIGFSVNGAKRLKLTASDVEFSVPITAGSNSISSNAGISANSLHVPHSILIQVPTFQYSAIPV